MNANPLVSIAIPSYGGGENLQRSVDSVLAQKYENWECIVVDDNGLGTPNQLKTAAVMERYAGEPRVKYICHEVNKNGSAARNTAIRSSKGEFVCVLDDDDEYTPEFLSTQVPVLSSLSKDYPMTYVAKANYVRGELYNELHTFENDDINLVDLFTEKFSIGACSFMLRREVYDRVGGYDESFRRHQDWEFLQKILAQYKKAKGIDKVCYKRHLTKRNNPRNSLQARDYRKHYLNKMEPYFGSLTKKEKKYIYDYHFATLSFIYVSNKDFFLFAKEFFKQMPGGIFYRVWYEKIYEIVNRGRLKA